METLIYYLLLAHHVLLILYLPHHFRSILRLERLYCPRISQRLCLILVESDYLRVKEGTNDPSVCLILVDPLPESSIPLMKRVAEYSMRDWSGGFFDKDKSNQVFLVRAAVGENEGIANLNIAAAPACTSMLKTSANNKFCAQ